MMKKPGIPPVPYSSPPDLARFLSALKERAEIYGGDRGGRIEPLKDNAGLSDVIAKINEIIEVMQ